MPPRLRAHSIAAAQPRRAAHHTAAAVLADAPRARTLMLVVVDVGAHPGLRPSPWVIDGVLDAIADSGLRGRSAVLGASDGADSLAARLAAADLPEATHEGRAHHDALRLRIPGSPRELRVPRSWVGSNLCLVLPCLHREQVVRGGPPRWRGPVGSGLLALTRPWSGASGHDSVELAARCVSELFAHVSVVIDASWWAPLSAEDRGAPLLLAPERTLGLQLASGIGTEHALDPRRVDAWLGQQLGLPGRRRGDAPALVGPAARTPWPRLPRASATGTRAARPGLAGQAVAALWRRTDRTTSLHAALPPTAPGALARLWDEYDRSGRGRGTRPA
ncbi:MAG: hypothetical protein AB1Z98_05670 [Nannocystaceae bacterium]